MILQLDRLSERSRKRVRSKTVDMAPDCRGSLRGLHDMDRERGICGSPRLGAGQQSKPAGGGPFWCVNVVTRTVNPVIVEAFAQCFGGLRPFRLGLGPICATWGVILPYNAVPNATFMLAEVQVWAFDVVLGSFCPMSQSHGSASWTGDLRRDCRQFSRRSVPSRMQPLLSFFCYLARGEAAFRVVCAPPRPLAHAIAPGCPPAAFPLGAGRSSRTRKHTERCPASGPHTRAGPAAVPCAHSGRPGFPPVAHTTNVAPSRAPALGLAPAPSAALTAPAPPPPGHMHVGGCPAWRPRPRAPPPRPDAALAAFVGHPRRPSRAVHRGRQICGPRGTGREFSATHGGHVYTETVAHPRRRPPTHPSPPPAPMRPETPRRVRAPFEGRGRAGGRNRDLATPRVGTWHCVRPPPRSPHFFGRRSRPHDRPGPANGDVAAGRGPSCGPGPIYC